MVAARPREWDDENRVSPAGSSAGNRQPQTAETPDPPERGVNYGANDVRRFYEQYRRDLSYPEDQR